MIALKCKQEKHAARNFQHQLNTFLATFAYKKRQNHTEDVAITPKILSKQKEILSFIKHMHFIWVTEYVPPFLHMPPKAISPLTLFPKEQQQNVSKL